MIDLQLHNVEGLEGIDEDIQKEIMSEAEAEAKASEDTKEDVKEEPTEAERFDTEEKVQDAEADSDNKQVEPEEKDSTDDDEEKKQVESDNVPYKRFKSVNEKRKALMSENEELKKRIEELTKTSSNAKLQEKQEPAQYKAEGFSQEQMEKIVSYAMQKVKEADKLTDEEIDAIKYSDDKVKSMAFERKVQAEIDKTIEGLKNIQKEKNELDRQWQESTKEFSDMNDRIMEKEDHEERMKYILETAFLKETARKQRCLQQSFARLQQKKGTSQDLEMVADYVKKAEMAYDKEQQKATNVAQKFDKAQGLPKAPNVNGGASADINYTLNDIENALNNGEWDNLPKEIRDKIMRGEPI